MSCIIQVNRFIRDKYRWIRSLNSFKRYDDHSWQGAHPKQYRVMKAFVDYEPYLLYITLLPCPIIITSISYAFALFSYKSWFMLSTMSFLLYFLLMGHDPSLFFFTSLLVTVLGNVLEQDQALHGFSNTGLLAIMTLMLLGKAIENCHVLDYMIEKIIGRSSNLYLIYLRLLPIVGIISAFINNTPVVTITLPILHIWSVKSNIQLSKLAMPVSFISMLGGTCTILGSSANLLVDSLLIELDTIHRFRFWEPGYVGLPLLVIGLFYLIIFSKHLLPKDGKLQKCLTRSYVVCRCVNNKVKINKVHGIDIAYIIRHDVDEMDDDIDVYNHNILEIDEDNYGPGDYLLIYGIQECLQNLYVDKDTYGLELLDVDEVDIFNLKRNIYQGHIKTINNGIKNIHKIIRQGIEIRKEIRDSNDDDWPMLLYSETLNINDTVIFSHNHRPDKNVFYDLQILPYWQKQTEFNRKTLLSIFLFVCIATIIVIDSFRLLDLYILTTFVLLVFIILRLSTWQSIIQQTNWSIYLLLSSSIGLSSAIKYSGIVEEAADLLAPTLASQTPIIVTLLLLHIFTTFMSSLLANPGVISIMIPVAHTITTRYHLDSKVFYAVVMLASSTSFLTSFSYQTNILVQSETGYKAVDFLKLGLPLTIITTIVTVGLCYLIF